MHAPPSHPLPPPSLLATWLAGPSRVAPLGGGFSGAAVFLVDAPAGRFVLKPFRPGTDRERAAWVHGLVAAAGRGGVAEVPVPLQSSSGTTAVADADGVLWELVPFVSGRATDAPSSAAVAAATGVLARFHRAARSFEPPTTGPSPGIVRRLETLAGLARRPWSDLRRLATGPLADRVEEACGLFADRGGRDVVTLAATSTAARLPLQPVIRDVWSDHVLFDRDHPARVNAIVDFHAAGTDTPATDLARLLGSWHPAPNASGDDPWTAALEAYREAGGDDQPADLVRFLHAAGVVCGLDNWFRWTLEEGRRFDGGQRMLGRVDRLLGQLPGCLEALAERWRCPGLTRGNRNL